MSTTTNTTKTTYKVITRKDGTAVYRVRFRLTPGTNPVNETFDDIQDAERFCALVDQAGGAAARRARQASDDGAGRSVEAAYHSYMAQATGHIGDHARIEYEGYWRRYIKDAFGAWPLEALGRDQISEWVGDLRQRETVRSKQARERAEKEHRPLPAKQFLAPKTIRNVHGFLSAILNNEVLNERLTVNRAYKIEMPQEQKTEEIVFLTENEFTAFYDKVDDDWKPLVALIAGTGLRWSEATALKVEDFDIDAQRPVVRITRAWKRANNKTPYTLGAPKTRHGVRTVSLPPSVVREVRPALEKRKPGELVFQGPRSLRLRNEWATKRVLHPAIVAAGLGRTFGWHALRHSHASWQIARGVPLTMIQRRLGHSSIKVTSDTYGHLEPDALRVTAEAAEQALSGAMPEIDELEPSTHHLFAVNRG